MRIEDIIIDDRERGVFRVHRSSMTSDDLFRLEQQHIFNRCWLYVGHESEVANPGDYRRRTIAGRPLFMVRSREDGQVRVFLNSCTHRGSVICRSDAGNAQVFQCFYHAWTFSSKGELLGVPDQGAYGPAFNRSELGLKQPPRTDSYRGFYFVSFNPDIDDLATYLGEAKEHLDMILDQSEEGMRVISGVHKYTVNSNWKVVVENGQDGYHIATTHRTYFTYINSFGSDESGLTMQGPNPGIAKALGNGHTVVTGQARNGRPIAHWHPIYGEEARKPIAEARQRLVNKYGEARAYEIADTYRLLLIYPNLMINDITAIIVKYVEPLAADRNEITAWQLVPEGESQALRSLRLDGFLALWGPGGFAGPDDVEAFESCQAGYRATETEWSEISRGMFNPNPTGADEIQIRGFWRQWHANVQGLARADVQDRHSTDNPASPASSGEEGGSGAALSPNPEGARPRS